MKRSLYLLSPIAFAQPADSANPFTAVGVTITNPAGSVTFSGMLTIQAGLVRNHRVTFKSFPEQHHFFRRSKTCTFFETMDAATPVYAGVLTYIREWITGVTGESAQN